MAEHAPTPEAALSRRAALSAQTIRGTLRRFVVLAVPVLLVASLGLKLLFEQYQNSRFEVVASREEGYLRAVEVVVQQEFDDVIGDLDTLVTAISLYRWSADAAALEKLPALFVAYGQESARYDQIRLLDLDGQERVRVNFRGGRTEVVPPEALQNKADRPYFTHSRALQPHERYISALELNMEHGRVEQPLRPTIRFTASVYDSDGKKTGVLVMNYNANRIEERLRTFAGVGDPVDNLLVNARGQVMMDSRQSMSDWLVRATQEDTRLARVRPAWSAAMASGDDNGRLLDENGLLLFHRMEPLGSGRTRHADTLTTSPGHYRWTSVRFVPAQTLFANSFVNSFPGRIAMASVLGAMAAFMLIAAWYVERDVRRRREQMELLEGREAELGALIDAAPSGILVVDDRGVIVHANRELCALFGYEHDALVGQPVECLIPERLQRAHPDLRAGYFARPSPRKMAENTPEQALMARHRDGHEFPVAVNLNMFGSGARRRAIATVIDVRQRRQFEDSLKTARDQAQAASAAKSAFLATMSHEIRTPLNAIVGMSYLMSRGELTEDQRQDVAAIQSSSNALLALINDVLDFSRIEAGELMIEARHFLISDVLDNLRHMFRAAAETKGIVLEIGAVPAGVPNKVTLDPSRLQQILVNLVSNAIKFTEVGSVRLNLSIAEPLPADDRVMVRFTVSDTGIGIDPERQAKLFDPFVQADSSTSRKFGGSGLGLSIVKRLVELMNGRIGCESAVGAGARFWIELPFGIPDASATLSLGPSASREDVRVLLVGSDPAQVGEIRSYCQSFGWTLDVIDGSCSAPQQVCERLQSVWIDCVLVGDPGLTVVVLDTLRGVERPVPVLMLGEARQALCAHLAGPLNGSSLFNAINELVVAHGAAPGRLSLNSRLSSKHLWLADVRVLAVDDSELNLRVVERLLGLQGAIVTICQSGEAALARIESGDAFDVVLMDVQMPGMDGFETTQRIRSLNPAACPPIVALTAGTTKADIARAVDVGMCEHLSKPVDPVMLVRVVRGCVELAKGGTVVLVGAGPNALESPVDAPWPHIAGIDSEMASALMLGDQAFFASVLDTFMRNTHTVAAVLREAGEAGDVLAASRIIHKLRGQAGNVAALALQAAAGEAEAKLGEHTLADADPDGLIHTLEALRTDIEAWLAKRN
ncbi:ATP-binding protein [Nitrogeniibacter aestuarii]|uniref:ATP-binding protein n=1 Tax=Nitrogeniibacter aestuarii TaxID=2815343 RepID=UPI001D11DF61|nr:ATP-binding protein [Nitrogeniibacter aestuarii]